MLRALATDFFARSPVLIFPIIALGLFFVMFVAIGVWVARAQRQELDAAARLPFNDGEGHHG